LSNKDLLSDIELIYANKDTKIKSLADQLTDSQISISALQQTLSILKKANECLDNKSSEFNTDINSMMNLLSTIDTTVKNLTEQKTELEIDNDNLRKTIANLEKANAQYKYDIKELSSQ